MWAVEDELDELSVEIAAKEREYATWARAPYEGRMADPEGWDRAGHFLRQAIRDLLEKRAVLEAERDREDQAA